MTRLNPQVLFARIARDVPTDLHQHLFVTGSLAAAYHFSDQLQEQSLNTKDADLVVHPAGDVGSCRELAERLRDIGWTQKQDERFHPRADREPVDNLPFIRLCPPESHDYFIEFLTLPPPGQKEPLRSVPVELSDGW